MGEKLFNIYLIVGIISIVFMACLGMGWFLKQAISYLVGFLMGGM